MRIFIGSESGQARAERVLIWSIIQHRDPARVYEIYVMSDLVGFDRSGWTTGFSNYRYAIPHYAGFTGRAIYNDVDQIYLSDPAELFDLDMDGQGLLAVGSRARKRWTFDSSVALIDCAKLASIWTLRDAQTLSAAQMADITAAASELRGDLPACWNARNGEYQPGTSKVLHYTQLRTQPWRPFPGQFRYSLKAEGQVWLDLEHEADAAGFTWPALGDGRPGWPIRISSPSPAGEISAAVGDLMTYRPWIYFLDITASVAVGYFACWKYFTVEDYTIDQFFWFLVAGLALFRAGVFVNEIARMPEGRFLAVKTYWNIVCGIPLLTPSFMFEPWRREDRSEAAKRAATGKNAAPSQESRAPGLLINVCLALGAPIVSAVRFLIVGPLLVLHPGLKTPILSRLSHYFPALAPDQEIVPSVGFGRTLAEACCFFIVLFVIFAYSDDLVPWSTFAEFYALCVFAVGLKGLVRRFGRRSAAPDREPHSVTVSGPPVVDALLLPAGTRYQALRTLVPSVPYHNLAEAHRRLMAILPPEAKYRRRVFNVVDALRFLAFPVDATVDSMSLEDAAELDVGPFQRFHLYFRACRRLIILQRAVRAGLSISEAFDHCNKVYPQTAADRAFEAYLLRQQALQSRADSERRSARSNYGDHQQV